MDKILMKRKLVSLKKKKWNSIQMEIDMKRTIFIIFLVTFIMTFFINFFLANNKKKLDGDAISGYQKEGKYYVMNTENEYLEVSKKDWITNLFLWISIFVCGGICGVTMIISVFWFLILPALHKLKILD